MCLKSGTNSTVHALYSYEQYGGTWRCPSKNGREQSASVLASRKVFEWRRGGAENRPNARKTWQLAKRYARSIR